MIYEIMNNDFDRMCSMFIEKVYGIIRTDVLVTLYGNIPAIARKKGANLELEINEAYVVDFEASFGSILGDVA